MLHVHGYAGDPVKCEGACGYWSDVARDYDGHGGKVAQVVVNDGEPNALSFNYCEVAIKTDRDNGFDVTEVTS